MQGDDGGMGGGQLHMTERALPSMMAPRNAGWNVVIPATTNNAIHQQRSGGPHGKWDGLPLVNGLQSRIPISTSHWLSGCLSSGHGALPGPAKTSKCLGVATALSTPVPSSSW